MNRLDSVDNAQRRTDIPAFAPGDTVRVHVRIKESETKERLQVFEGVCIARKNDGIRETFTVRKTSFGVGVERIFPVHGPIIGRVEVVRRGRVRRAKLYYLRNLRGKAARIKESETKERLQAFEGVVIARKGDGIRETFTVRKTSFGVGVERIFPVHGPIIGRVEVVRRGRVRRAKLYYLRNLRGKAARIKELDTRQSAKGGGQAQGASASNKSK